MSVDFGLLGRECILVCVFLHLLTIYQLHFLGWNTKISARESNYGTRIDFILITPRLIPWISAADIQPHIKGSDHCPVFVDFRDEITDANGITIRLQDVLGVHATPGAAKEPPRLAAKFWNEYSGKQTSLKTFFGRQSADTQSLDKSSTSSLVSDTSIAAEPVAKPPLSQSSKSQGLTSSLSPSLFTTTTSVSLVSKRKITVDPGSSSKRLKLENESTKPKERNPGKSTIASFFSQPMTRNSQTTASSSTLSKGKDKAIETQPHADNDITLSDGLTQPDEDADYRLALLLSSQDSIPSSSQGRPEKETREAWNNLLAPIQPPKCLIHREPAKELTVTKQGPNKGKKFFICSR